MRRRDERSGKREGGGGGKDMGNVFREEKVVLRVPSMILRRKFGYVNKK